MSAHASKVCHANDTTGYTYKSFSTRPNENELVAPSIDSPPKGRKEPQATNRREQYPGGARSTTE